MFSIRAIPRITLIHPTQNFNVFRYAGGLAGTKNEKESMKYLIFIAVNCIIFPLLAQEFSISGSIQSHEDQSTFPGATVVVQNPGDSSIIKGSITDYEGHFKISGLSAGTYLIKADFIGYQTLYQKVDLTRNLDMGTLALVEDTKVLEAVEVVGKPVAAMQKGDTTQFSARAYKTAPDASSQELIEKLPGISTQDGKLQANGEDIQVILVDGKPFFGGDVNAALQNLPADVVASIQIFDKKSDKAALSGFDDGAQQKAINIITKPSRRVGQFGKSTIGVGTGGTYQGGASVNFFNNDRRITVTGLSNNINTTNYSADPGSMGDNINANGLIKTNNLGINFSDHLGSKFELNGNYQFSREENEQTERKLRDYALASDSGQIYSEDRYSNRLNVAHRLGLKLEYKINENNVLLMRPHLSFRNEESINDFLGQTTSGSSPVNATDNTATASYQDYDYDNNLYYSRKFGKKGRSFTSRLHTGWHTNEDRSRRYAENQFFNESDSLGILDQRTTRSRTGISWEVQASYTEPLGEHSMMELEYEIGDRIDDSDKLTYDADESGDYNALDTALSNTFKSEYLRQKFEVGYQWQNEGLKLQVETEFQRSDMSNDQVFPTQTDLNKGFSSLLPSARLDYRLSEDKRIELSYRTSTRQPSIGDLQDVIDNSNALQLSAGNPDLNQTYNHKARARFWSSDPENGKSLYASVESSFSQNLITNSTFIAEEPLEVAEGVILEQGSQFTRPANVDGYYQFRSYMSYGNPLEVIKSNIRFNGGVNFTRKPGLVNDVLNFSDAHNYRLGVSLNTNISETFDVNISTRSSYNVAKNSLRPSLNNNYYNQTTRLKYRWVFLGGFVYRADLRHQLNTGLSEGYDNSSMLLNMSAGRKFLKNDLAEISVNVYDLLQQNNNARRNITELYIEDQQSTVLERYFMLTFTYNIRHFSAGTTREDFEDI
ncbi:outer membrane beta-barrel protein [Marinoscillum sp. 108]|uniref:outer membrane beta-barrel protein n=1 Tax=Marinoscillum sp. 108 TaxID=2653151 RepID=UPI00135CD6DB|nr:outer membrane beta-barrel protein [Marinoscillum sp. 108]